MSSLIDALLFEPHADAANIYVAVRAEKGSGTLNDPYGANTPAKFDAIMKEISDAMVADENSLALIHLGPGHFGTAGYTDAAPTANWQARARMKIVGSGIGVTFLDVTTPTTSSRHYSPNPTGMAYLAAILIIAANGDAG